MVFESDRTKSLWGRLVAKRAAKWYHLRMTATVAPEQVAELERSGGSPLVVENPQTWELDRLQNELATHQRLVSPRPVAILQLLEETLQQRAINATGRVV